MNHLKLHIVIAGRVFIVFFLLSNAGFTTVLEHCTMQSASCCESSACAMSCDMNGRANGELFLDSGCHSLAIVGGRASNDGVGEKGSRETVSGFTALPLHSMSGDPACHSDPLFIVPVHQSTTRLHSKKYLLHEAFLN
jgi:hypothetical protein